MQIYLNSLSLKEFCWKSGVTRESGVGTLLRQESKEEREG